MLLAEKHPDPALHGRQFWTLWGDQSDSNMFKPPIEVVDLGDRYLGEIGLLQRVFGMGRNVVIESPPNTGKSWAAIEYLKGRVPFVFVADTTVLMSDLASTHGLDAFSGRFKVPQEIKAAITIPDHAAKFARRDRVLVVDEWHSLVTDHNYRAPALESMASSFPEWKQVVALTGTYLSDVAGFERIEVKTSHRPTKVSLMAGRHPLESLKRELERRPTSVHWVFVLSAGRLFSKVHEAMQESGIPRSAILELRSANKTRQEIMALLQTNQLGEEFKAVISTYRQGFSVKDENPTVVHVLPGYTDSAPRHSPADIAQIAHRFRSQHFVEAIMLHAQLPPGPNEARPDAKLGREWNRAYAERAKLYKEAFGVTSLDQLSKDQQRVLLAAEASDPNVLSSLNMGELNRLIQRDMKENELSRHHYVYSGITRWAYQSTGNMKGELDKVGICLNADFVEEGLPADRLEDALAILEDYGESQYLVRVASAWQNREWRAAVEGLRFWLDEGPGAQRRRDVLSSLFVEGERITEERYREWLVWAEREDSWFTEALPPTLKLKILNRYVSLKRVQIDGQAGVQVERMQPKGGGNPALHEGKRIVWLHIASAQQTRQILGAGE